MLASAREEIARRAVLPAAEKYPHRSMPSRDVATTPRGEGRREARTLAQDIRSIEREHIVRDLDEEGGIKSQPLPSLE